jgi:hypothetical protein
MDEADAAQDEIEKALACRIAAARGEIPVGTAGECESCGEESLRLVAGTCAPCRDKEAKYKNLRRIYD